MAERCQCWSLRRHMHTTPVSCTPSRQKTRQGSRAGSISVEMTDATTATDRESSGSSPFTCFVRWCTRRMPSASHHSSRSAVGSFGVRATTVLSRRRRKNRRFLRVGYADRYTSSSTWLNRRGGKRIPPPDDMRAPFRQRGTQRGQ